MFAVTGADAAAIRTAFHEEGELSAAIELRRVHRQCESAGLRSVDAAADPALHRDAAASQQGRLLLITYFDENAGRGRAA